MKIIDISEPSRINKKPDQIIKLVTDGKSIQEGNCETIIDDIFKLSKNHSCSIIFPEDVIVGKNL